MLTIIGFGAVSPVMCQCAVKPKQTNKIISWRHSVLQLFPQTTLIFHLECACFMVLLLM
jgi:hypothetical protein